MCIWTVVSLSKKRNKYANITATNYIYWFWSVTIVDMVHYAFNAKQKLANQFKLLNWFQFGNWLVRIKNASFDLVFDFVTENKQQSSIEHTIYGRGHLKKKYKTCKHVDEKSIQYESYTFHVVSAKKVKKKRKKKNQQCSHSIQKFN